MKSQGYQTIGSFQKDGALSQKSSVATAVSIEAGFHGGGMISPKPL
jgi:hypothetical protein